LTVAVEIYFTLEVRRNNNHISLNWDVIGLHFSKIDEKGLLDITVVFEFKVVDECK